MKYLQSQTGDIDTTFIKLNNNNMLRNCDKFNTLMNNLMNTTTNDTVNNKIIELQGMN